MLPPYVPLVAVEIACPSGGATPKQPIIGASDSDQSRSLSGGLARRTLPASLSISHSTRSDCGRPATNPGSTTLDASTENVQPVARFGVMRLMTTDSASPGSAPSTKNGPVIGFGRVA